MKIYAIPGLVASCYIIKDSGLFLIDTGFLGFGKRILKKIQKIGKNRDLKLIVVSHDHIDHFGGLHEVHACSGAPVACHKLDSEGVSSASIKISPPVTAFGKGLEYFTNLFFPFLQTRGVTPQVHLTDGMSLEEFGLRGQVIHTPGHTKGSISILLEDGSAFVGDLVMGKTIINNHPSPGAFAENLSELRESWIKILTSGAKTIYPAHGNPFAAAELENLIKWPLKNPSS